MFTFTPGPYLYRLSANDYGLQIRVAEPSPKPDAGEADTRFGYEADISVSQDFRTDDRGWRVEIGQGSIGAVSTADARLLNAVRDDAIRLAERIEAFLQAGAAIGDVAAALRDVLPVTKNGQTQWEIDLTRSAS